MLIIYCLLTICSILIDATDESELEGVVISERLQRTFSKHGSLAEEIKAKRMSLKELEFPTDKKEQNASKSFLATCKKFLHRSFSFNPAAQVPEIVEPAVSNTSLQQADAPWNNLDKSSIEMRRPRKSSSQEGKSYEIVLPAAETIMSKTGKLTKEMKSSSFAEGSNSSYPSISVQELAKAGTIRNSCNEKKQVLIIEKHEGVEVVTDKLFFDVLIKSYQELPSCPTNIYTINNWATKLRSNNYTTLISSLQPRAAELDITNLVRYIVAFNAINILAEKQNNLLERIIAKIGPYIVNADEEKGFVEGIRQMRYLNDPWLNYYGKQYAEIQLKQILYYHTSNKLVLSTRFKNALTKSKLKPMNFDDAYLY